MHDRATEHMSEYGTTIQARYGVFPCCCNKFGTSCQQLVTGLMALSDLLQGCSNKSGTALI